MGAGWQRWWRDKPDNPERSGITTVPGTSDNDPQFEAPDSDAIECRFVSWMWWCPVCCCYDSFPHVAHAVFTVEEFNE